MAENAEQVAIRIVGQLERAWNAGDGDSWGRLFAEDADFVTVRGEYLRGREAITQGHQAIFRTIYQGSTNQYELLRTRALGDGAIVAHVRARLVVTDGPMAGEHHAVLSLVLATSGAGWQIVSLHNTIRAEESFSREHGLDRWQDHAARRRS